MKLDVFKTIMNGIAIAHDEQQEKIEISKIAFEPSLNILNIETQSPKYEISATIRGMDQEEEE